MRMTEEPWPSAEARMIHAGTERDLGAPATPPLTLASVHASWGEPDPSRAYGRTGNPSWEALEEALGVLEDADVVVFSSGQAAAMALMLALAGGRRSLLLPSAGYYNIPMLGDWLRAASRGGAGPGRPAGPGRGRAGTRARSGPAVGRDPDQPAAAGVRPERAGRAGRRGRRPAGGGQHGGDRAVAAAPGPGRGGLADLADQVRLGTLGRTAGGGSDPGPGTAG